MTEFYYTPQNVIELMLKNAPEISAPACPDPCAGTGTFSVLVSFEKGDRNV